MSTADKLQLAAVVVAVLALGREYLGARTERKRAQPVVIAHERRAPGFSRDDRGWTAIAWLTNDGADNAFNVRFGIELRGVRFPYRLQRDDPRSGNRQRVIRMGDATPDTEIQLESLEAWQVASLKQDGAMWESRVYWAATKTRQARRGKRATRRNGQRS